MSLPPGEVWPARLLEVRALGPDTWSPLLEARLEGKPLSWSPGQHVALRPEHAGDAPPLLLSIASAPDPARPGRLRLLVELPEGSPRRAWIASASPDERWWVEGPFGDFAPPPPAEGPLLLVGLGTGVAPLRAIVQATLRRGPMHDVVLLFGARSPGRLWFHEQFTAWSVHHPHFRYVPTVSRPADGWTGRRGRVQRHLAEVLSAHGPVRAMVCGALGAVDDVRSALMAHGMPAERIRTEGH